MISLSIGVERSVRNFGHVFELELSLAERIYQEQGREALSEFLESTDASFESRHYLLNRNGRDVVTGDDRSALLASKSVRSRVPRLMRSFYKFVTDAEGTNIRRSQTGDFAIVVIARPWAEARAQFPFYLAVLMIVSVLNSLVAVRIVSSLRAIARAAETFGEGALETRVQGAARQDEVGLVAAAFQCYGRSHSRSRSPRNAGCFRMCLTNYVRRWLGWRSRQNSRKCRRIANRALDPSCRTRSRPSRLWLRAFCR